MSEQLRTDCFDFDFLCVYMFVIVHSLTFLL